MNEDDKDQLAEIIERNGEAAVLRAVGDSCRYHANDLRRHTEMTSSTLHTILDWHRLGKRIDATAFHAEAAIARESGLP